MTQTSSTDCPLLGLRRVDPERNIARFYVLSLQPTLFGDIDVVRAWGRIGTTGRQKSDSYGSVHAACSALAKLALAKRRRGYCGNHPEDSPTGGASAPASS
ncbi:WGR domain-containing protein [Rhizobium sp. TRM95111]|uniref:WGR domain-containing protein n=1 Tax=Rhizobium alarense TaxID=2846851 RepID=UPI001F45FF12|nr:WGR domain-containing protein [Rhizobium alarense]MCF3640245.1 WGR domain-containing protein [Rhizobium alarense]